jgi:Rrf2 family nitric oxide-sensitive transcriptional repressor
MRLTLHTDYSLRVLLYLANKKGELATITEIADFYNISRNHLVKVVHHLGRLGFILTVRGKNGGMRLAMDPAKITVGEVVRKTEPDFDLLECFNPETDHCSISSICRLKAVFFKASRVFLDELDRYTLAEGASIALLAPRKAYVSLEELRKTTRKAKAAARS